jgi:hypothetical protein
VKVSGRVTSPDGAPLPGVTLTLSGDDGAETTTDANGDYAIPGVCPGSYELIPSSEGLMFCRESARLADLKSDTVADFSGSPEGCDTAPLERRVLVLVYDPLVGSDGDVARRLSAAKGWDEPASTIASFVHAIEAVSNGHVRYQISELRVLDVFPAQSDSFRYSEPAYSACLDNTALCHEPEALDYDSVATEQGICSLLESGTVDEIWLAGGPHFGLSSWHELSGCRRTADLAGFDHSRGLAGMFAGLHARSEAALAQVFDDYPPSRFDEFRRVETNVTSGGASGCGSATSAPNARADHPFDDLRPVPCYCDAYYGYPWAPESSPLVEPVTCQAWGCSEIGYRQYWFRHLPSRKGADAGGLLSDWWRYVLTPDDRFLQTEMSCSPSYADGWCPFVKDGRFGECNDGEWATAALPQGWVEFNWPGMRPIHSVRIHDRACMERVVRGHIEFSDGSDPIEFGPLDNSGITPEIKSFPEKLLSSMRVHIDESTGMNPGFGEIVIE